MPCTCENKGKKGKGKGGGGSLLPSGPFQSMTGENTGSFAKTFGSMRVGDTLSSLIENKGSLPSGGAKKTKRKYTKKPKSKSKPKSTKK